MLKVTAVVMSAGEVALFRKKIELYPRYTGWRAVITIGGESRASRWPLTIVCPPFALDNGVFRWYHSATVVALRLNEFALPSVFTELLGSPFAFVFVAHRCSAKAVTRSFVRSQSHSL